MKYIVFYNRHGNQKLAIFFHGNTETSIVKKIMDKATNIAIGNDYSFTVLDSESVNKNIPLIDGKFLAK